LKALTRRVSKLEGRPRGALQDLAVPDLQRLLDSELEALQQQADLDIGLRQQVAHINQLVAERGWTEADVIGAMQRLADQLVSAGLATAPKPW
jgi:hypothetical protein